MNQVWINVTADVCVYVFQGVDASPGIKGKKGVLGFPGTRVKNHFHFIDEYGSVQAVSRLRLAAASLFVFSLIN